MAAEGRKVRGRTRRRVEGDGKASTVVKTAQHRGNQQAPLENGTVEITCQASELVPVAQYANVTIGPVAVRRLVQASSLDEIKQAIVDTQQVIYEVIAEDREAVEESVRLHNQRQAEKEKEQAKSRG